MIVGCTSGHRALVVGETIDDPAVVGRSCEGLPADAFSLGQTMTIEPGRILKVSVSYGGGCEEHTFGACWNGAISKSNPSTLTLEVAHDDHDDLCDAFVTRDLFIDISELPQDFASPERGEAANTIRFTQLPTR